MATPDFILRLREKVGHEMLWLTGVTAVVVRGDDVLLIERADNGMITPVTGIVDPGEQPAAAAMREVTEETDIVVEAESLVQVRSLPPMRYANGDEAQYLDIVFRCRYISGDPHPADGENARAWWHPVSDLDASGLNADMSARVRAALEHRGSARFETEPDVHPGSADAEADA
ncbi:NUDIX hydrolase [Microbacterium halotolerans]|uniref:NUDIX hydrolase n=1 Tax=Microbacterium halotolerans TaxID=246613 RepID=UPI000E6A9B3E|nr:NUDIX domain-containing protein [Microbacterium halotolerans]